MSQPLIDLSYFERKARRKIRLAIFMGKLLHFIYLVVKNFRKNPDQLTKYDSFLQLISDKEFVVKVLKKEGGTSKPERDSLKYLKFIDVLMKRGYSGLLEIMDIIWDLTVHHNRISPRTLFNIIIGLTSPRPSFLDEMKFYGKVSYSWRPFMMNVNQCNFVVIEAELGEKTEALAKTLIYLGSLTGTDKSLGLFARFSIRSIDAEYMISKQDKGYVHRLVRIFRFYPTVLRMQRIAYRKVRAVEEMKNEILNMLSELYMDENKIVSLVSMDIPANILAMAPSISLGGGLCFATAFRGELLDDLRIGKEARIKVADITIKAYPSYYSVLPYQSHPGDYVLVVFHPFTAPRVGLIVATYTVDVLDQLKPRRRNITILDKLFPKVKEVVKTYS